MIGAEGRKARPARRRQFAAAQGEHYCVFDTAIGHCGVAWNSRGITRVQLPEADRSATERRLRNGSGGAALGEPPPVVGEAIVKIRRYLAGETIDFAGVGLDLTGVSAFHRKVYDAARRIGWGRTTTYGELARRAGAPGAARAVGQALGRNPVPIIVPCHRIIASGGKVGGFSAFGGANTKERLLALEGVHPRGELPLLAGSRWRSLTGDPRSADARGDAHPRAGSGDARR
jgi:methylated-DNA-[protein]-cysteine S-methyltransferase